MIPPPGGVSSFTTKTDQGRWEEMMSKLRISIGPVELHARLLDTPAAKAIREALPFLSEARISDNFVSFTAPDVAPMRPCRLGSRRAGDFVLTGEGGFCGIDISKLPFVRNRKRTSMRRASNVWARAMGDIAALQHVMDGDPVAVEILD